MFALPLVSSLHRRGIHCTWASFGSAPGLCVAGLLRTLLLTWQPAIHASAAACLLAAVSVLAITRRRSTP